MVTHVDALIKKEDKFLAVEIIDHPGSGLHTGMLHLPGGRPEKGESLLETVKREVLEETGYELNLINDDPIFDRTVDFAGDDHRFVVFDGEIAGGKERMQEGEIVAIRWVTGEEFLQSLKDYMLPETIEKTAKELFIQEGLV